MQADVQNILGSSEVVIPPGVNATSPEQQDLYRAALEFERFFVTHLMRQMDDATKALKVGGEDSDEGIGGSTAAYDDMVRDQMAQAVLDGGGLGLASVIYSQVSGQAGGGAGPATGGGAGA